MIKLGSKIRVRYGVGNPSEKIKNYLGKEGTVIEYLGKREEKISDDLTVVNEYYNVKFGREIVEMNMGIFDKRSLRIE